jgi:hypothetical protein
MGRIGEWESWKGENKGRERGTKSGEGERRRRERGESRGMAGSLAEGERICKSILESQEENDVRIREMLEKPREVLGGEGLEGLGWLGWAGD